MSEEEVALEAALWTTLRSLEESASLSRRLADRATARGQSHAASRFGASARDFDARAKMVRSALDLGRAERGSPDSGGGAAAAESSATAAMSTQSAQPPA